MTKLTPLLIVAIVFSSAAAFSTNTHAANESVTSSDAVLTRRAALVGSAVSLFAGIAASPPSASAAAPFKLGDKSSVVGREIQSFEGLIQNFKNTALDGGLDASKLQEPSVPFIEFGEKMKNGEVSFVEFLAPGGEVAYATFKDKGGKESEPIRIGQGYPTGGKNSWSSPDYVIRSVSNFGVPYKFTVPMLANFKS